MKETTLPRVSSDKGTQLRTIGRTRSSPDRAIGIAEPRRRMARHGTKPTSLNPIQVFSCRFALITFGILGAGRLLGACLVNKPILGVRADLREQIHAFYPAGEIRILLRRARACGPRPPVEDPCRIKGSVVELRARLADPEQRRHLRTHVVCHDTRHPGSRSASMNRRDGEWSSTRRLSA